MRQDLLGKVGFAQDLGEPGRACGREGSGRRPAVQEAGAETVCASSFTSKFYPVRGAGEGP